jgi:hypothetical protein
MYMNIDKNLSILMIGVVILCVASFIFGYKVGSDKEEIIVPPFIPIKVECIECDSLQTLLNKERQHGDSLSKLLKTPFIEPKNKPGVYRDSTTSTKLDRIIGIK